MTQRRDWTAEDVQTAAQVYRDAVDQGSNKKEAFVAVALALHRVPLAISQRYYQRGPTFAGSARWPRHAPTATEAYGVNVRIPVPDHVVADRDFRKTLEPQSLTAELMGDPPPGYSALDRRQG